METAYFSLGRSSLEYSSAVWDPFRQKDIDKLEKNQRAAWAGLTWKQDEKILDFYVCMFKILNR